MTRAKGTLVNEGHNDKEGLGAHNLLRSNSVWRRRDCHLPLGAIVLSSRELRGDRRVVNSLSLPVATVHYLYCTTVFITDKESSIEGTRTL